MSLLILVALIFHGRLPPLQNSYVGLEKNTLLFDVLNLPTIPPSLAGMQTSNRPCIQARSLTIHARELAM
jgi:hypothetical protein